VTRTVGGLSFFRTEIPVVAQNDGYTMPVVLIDGRLPDGSHDGIGISVAYASATGKEYSQNFEFPSDMLRDILDVTE